MPITILKKLPISRFLVLAGVCFVTWLSACQTTYTSPSGEESKALIVGTKNDADSLELLSPDLMGMAFSSYLAGFVSEDTTDMNGQVQMAQPLIPVDSLRYTDAYPIKQGNGDYYVVCRATQQNSPRAWLFAARCTWQERELLLIQGQELYAICWRLNCPSPVVEWDVTSVKGFSALPAGCEYFRQQLGK